MRNTAVITHYDMDISWIDEIVDQSIELYIYSNSGNTPPLKRETKKYTNPKNIGREAHLYLSFIIENYDNLPDNILFLHSHRTDWSQDFPLPFIIDKINWDFSDYFNISSRNHYNSLFTQLDYGHGSPKDWLLKSWSIFNDKFNFPEEILYYAGGQFKVSKELILNHKKEFYQDLDKWILSTDLPDWISGRIFEYTWHLIFTGDPIDRKFKNSEIFHL